MMKQKIRQMETGKDFNLDEQVAGKWKNLKMRHIVNIGQHLSSRNSLQLPLTIILITILNKSCQMEQLRVYEQSDVSTRCSFLS